MRIILLLFVFGTLLFGCSPTEESPLVEPPVPVAPPPTTQLIPTPLTVIIDDLRVRAQPTLDAPSVGDLPEGTTVTATGRLTDTTLELTLRGIPLNEPWVEIEFQDQQAWVYGGGLGTTAADLPPAFAKWRDERFRYLFGNHLLDDVNALRRHWESISTDLDFSEYWENWTATKKAINERLTSFTIDASPPNWEWLKGIIPGSETTWIASDTVQLFTKIPYWINKTTTTTGTGDEDFFKILLDFYSLDSIEYTQPAFVLAPSATEKYSLLGSNIHLELLRKMNDYQSKHQLFKPSIFELKHLILNDITAGRQLFWLSPKAVKSELEAILKTPLPILTQEDQIMLLTQKEHLDDPKKYRIVMGIKENGR